MAPQALLKGKSVEGSKCRLSAAFLVLDIYFERGGKPLFTGTTLLGYTGLVMGLKEGAFSYSNDARCQGGKLLDNMLQMLLTGAQTPPGTPKVRGGFYL